ncbi:hypothetical protein PPERSA_09895 [Pseudocohnilembus persalinus]|uniref:Uncharacterized protein n=1 Tax=Pseudocohnilembus persalinus TaxID=266149 RepID=A0A0V0QU73_PSEPJ|nr:hypothetical protein PPERSA_09895 [Pseudocohnilembus persalinus]|eukprot:KRX05755.1 hypothetical protein PPERSA_09895 [Pseudocohnilembus persalinus]
MTTTNNLVFDPFLKECASFLYQYNQLQEELNQPEINEQVISNCETKIKACQYILELAKNKINGVNGKYRSPGRQILKNSKTPRLSQQLKFSQGLMQQDQKNYTPKNKHIIQNSIQESFENKTNENNYNYSSQDYDDQKQFISLDKTDKKKLRQYPEQIQVSSYAEYNSKLKENPYNFSPNTLNVKKLNINENSSSKIPSTMPSQNFQNSFDSSTIKQHSQLKINFNKFEVNNKSEIQDDKTENKFQKQKTPKNLNFEDSLQNSEIKNPSFQLNEIDQKDYNIQSANNFEKNPKIEYNYQINKTFSNSNYQNVNTNKEDTYISNNSKNENDNSYQDLSLSQNQIQNQQNKKSNDSQDSSEKISNCRENNNQNKVSYIQEYSKQAQEKLTIDKNENINNDNDKQKISQNQISFQDYINIKTEEDTKEFLEKLDKSSEKNNDIKYEYKNLQKYNVDSYNALNYKESNYSTKSYNKIKYKIKGELEVSTASYANYSKGEFQQYNDQPATYNNSSLKFNEYQLKLDENQKSEQGKQLQKYLQIFMEILIKYFNLVFRIALG